MEHTKKLVLVDPKFYRASMREKTLSRLDEDIEKTLNSELPDDQKVTDYIAALRRYKYFEVPHTKEEEEPKANIESKILDTVPVELRHKAKRLMEHLKRDPSVQIGEKGELIHNQQKIENSHLGDLMNELIQKKSQQHQQQQQQHEDVKGWNEFESILRGYNLSNNLSEHLNRVGGKQKTKRQSKAHQQAPPSLLSSSRTSTPSASAVSIARASYVKKKKSSKGRLLKVPGWLKYD